jgi:predicted RNA-binding Zn-ribbon protein involved in translation (DUF1610 family)
MKNESANPVQNEKPIYTQFTCPDCGGNALRAIVESYATITGFDDNAVYYVLDEEDKQDHNIPLFFCDNCGYDTEKESSVRDYVK